MEGSTKVLVINIHPENWDECLAEHTFGLRKGARRPSFGKGDLFLVRKTGKEYGVLGLWFFSHEKQLLDQSDVPWEDAEYSTQQFFDPYIDFETPMSEDFSGISKFSEKIQIPAMSIVGSMLELTNDVASRYLNAIKSEKANELMCEVEYQGERITAMNLLERLLVIFEIHHELIPTITDKKQRDLPVGEPINFRGMVYAPLNEAGVVLLFSKIMDDLGIVYESSPPTGFDMVGRQRTDKGYERKHFEFEYRSSNFRVHGHDPCEVDYIVCWEHDWRNCPSSLEVIDLKELIKDLPAQFQ